MFGRFGLNKRNNKHIYANHIMFGTVAIFEKEKMKERLTYWVRSIRKYHKCKKERINF